MIKIAVIGIAGESVFLGLKDFGKIGQTVVAQSFYKELGGKGFNQALSASRYGAKVCFLSAVNKKDVQSFTKIANENGIDAYFIGKDQPSPYAVIETDERGDNKVLVYQGAKLTEQDVDLFEQQIKTANVLLINNEVPVSVNEKAVNIAKANGVKVVLNPAPCRKYDKEFLDKIDLFTPNEHETEGLEGYKNVVVTLGDKGCKVLQTGKTIPAQKVSNVVDTTGAGDTFNGVLATCLAQGESLEKACEIANVASAIKIGKKFILESIPTKTEIQKYLEKKNG